MGDGADFLEMEHQNLMHQLTKAEGNVEELKARVAYLEHLCRNTYWVALGYNASDRPMVEVEAHVENAVLNLRADLAVERSEVERLKNDRRMLLSSDVLSRCAWLMERDGPDVWDRDLCESIAADLRWAAGTETDADKGDRLAQWIHEDVATYYVDRSNALLKTLLGLHDAEVFVREPWDTTFDEVREHLEEAQDGE